MHSNPSEACSSCAQKLEGCHNSLKLWFEIIADNFQDCHISEGFRNEEQQNEDLQNKLTKAKWPLSKHNRMDNGKPSSWAIDVFRLSSGDGKAYFEENYLENIWIFINKIQTQAGDQELYWGGLFQSLKDFVHFELLKVDVHQCLEVLSQDKC